MIPTGLDGLIENVSHRKNMTFSEYVIDVLKAHFAKYEIESDAFGNITDWGKFGEPTPEEKELIKLNREATVQLKRKIKKSKTIAKGE